MTDGPYAPLSMSRQWNEFGRALLRPAFEEDIAPCLQRAVLHNARREQVGELIIYLKGILAPKEPDFFGDGQKAALDIARSLFPAPMAQSALDHCEGALQEGQRADDAINHGAAASMRERARDSANSIEAHLIGQEGVEKAHEAQSRCEALLTQTDWTVMVEKIQDEPPSSDAAGGAGPERTEIGPPMVPSP